METNKYIEKIKGIAKKIQEHLPIGIKKWAISLAFVATVLTACGRTVETNTPATPGPDTTIETVVDPIDEEKTEPNIEEDHNKTPDDQEVKPEENNLPEPTFVQTSENNYTVTVDCPDNSNAPEVQTARGYSFVENSEITAGVSSDLIAAVVAAGMKDGQNNRQIDFDEYKDYVFPTYDFAFHVATPAVFTDTPEAYSDTMTVTRSSYEKFDDGYCYIIPLMVQESLVSTDFNLTCALARIDEGPANWDRIMQDFEAKTGLTKAEAYANYDAKTIYEALGLEYSGYAERVISMVSSDVLYAAKTTGDGSYVTYTIDRTKVKSM